jgi:solute carrier family 25 protein 39/40
MASLLEEMRAGGTLGAATTLFRGLGPTLLRVVPFSMIYWTAYESTKRHLRAPAAAPLGTAAAAAAAAESPESRSRRIGVSFVSGLAAGSVAATFTTPLDVVKTRVQIRMYSAEEAPAGRVELRSRAWATAAAIWKQDGWRGFFVGLTPRVAKVAPSCAIMISTYEVVKALFADTGAP